jgi:AmiR/NasT family two-component response regulator
VTRIQEVAERVDRAVRSHEAPRDPAVQRALAEQAIQDALRARTVIGQAMGLLMSDLRVSGDAAFAHLVELSSRSNVKLRDVALSMVADAETRLSPGT